MQEYEFFYIKFFFSRTGKTTGGEKKLEIFTARNETEAGEHLVKFCLDGKHGYVHDSFYLREGVTKTKLRDPTFPPKAQAA